MARGNHITRNGKTRSENRKMFAQIRAAKQKKIRAQQKELADRLDSKGLGFHP